MKVSLLSTSFFLRGPGLANPLIVSHRVSFLIFMRKYLAAFSSFFSVWGCIGGFHFISQITSLSPMLLWCSRLMTAKHHRSLVFTVIYGYILVHRSIHSPALDPGWHLRQFPAPGNNKDSLTLYKQIAELVFYRRFRYALAIGALSRAFCQLASL